MVHYNMGRPAGLAIESGEPGTPRQPVVLMEADYPDKAEQNLYVAVCLAWLALAREPHQLSRTQFPVISEAYDNHPDRPERDASALVWAAQLLVNGDRYVELMSSTHWNGDDAAATLATEQRIPSWVVDVWRRHKADEYVFITPPLDWLSAQEPWDKLLDARGPEPA